MDLHVCCTSVVILMFKIAHEIQTPVARCHNHIAVHSATGILSDNVLLPKCNQVRRHEMVFVCLLDSMLRSQPMSPAASEAIMY